jgi:hypothetical protein
MLPINTQAQANTDKLILDTLQRQGEELSRQSKTLEKLVNELFKQTRSNDKVRSNAKAQASTDGKEQGFFEKPMADLMKDLRSMFKFESGGKEMFKFESGGKKKQSKGSTEDNSNEKGKTKGEDQEILKDILDKFVQMSDFQKQMTAHTETLKMISDITKTNIAIMKDDFAYVKKSYEDGERDKDRELLAEQIAEKLGVAKELEDNPIDPNNNEPQTKEDQQSLSNKMGKAVAENISKGFGTLLTTQIFKTVTEKQTDRIVEALQEISSGGGGLGGGSGFDMDLPDGSRRNRRGTPGNGSRNQPKGGPKGKPGGKPPTPKGKIPFGKIALGAVSAGILFEGLTYSEELNKEEEEKLEQYREENPELFKNDKDILDDPNADKDAKRIAAKNIKMQEDIKKYGIDEAKRRAEARDRIDERLKQRKDEQQKVESIKKEKLNQDETGKQLDKPKWKMDASPQAPLVIPEDMNNLSDTGNINNDISSLAQTNAEDVNASLTPVTAKTPKLLDIVTEEKQEMVENKAVTPVTIINNNTNNVGQGGGGQSMNFAAATAVNTDTSINDFFRSHGRIYA